MGMWTATRQAGGIVFALYKLAEARHDEPSPKLCLRRPATHYPVVRFRRAWQPAVAGA